MPRPIMLSVRYLNHWLSDALAALSGDPVPRPALTGFDCGGRQIILSSREIRPSCDEKYANEKSSDKTVRIHYVNLSLLGVIQAFFAV